MFDKVQSIYKSEYVQQFRDVRALGLVVFGVLVLLVSWSGVQAIQANFELQKQISQLGQENDVQELANTNLRLSNEYYNTDRYLELAARRQFGKGAPGETLLLVPKNVALSHAPDLSEKAKVADAEPAAKKPFYQKNFEAWLDFFLHRPPSED